MCGCIHEGPLQNDLSRIAFQGLQIGFHAAQLMHDGRAQTKAEAFLIAQSEIAEQRGAL